MSLVCEISGEPLSLFVGSSSYDSIVVTPSGHVCRKSLLLTKLSENGGMDPFETGRPLPDGELVELQQLRASNTSSVAVATTATAKQFAFPPRSLSSSVSQTLQQLQRDYDAVILELFDTRQLLTETRQELSLALYENDAAVRVVARLAAERDQALAAAVHTLETRSKEVATNTVIREEQAVPVVDDSEPPTKRNKTEASSTASAATDDAATDKMPLDDWNIMVAAWEKLHVNRKARQKAASKRAVSLEQVQTFVPTTLQSPPNKPSSSQFTSALAYCANDHDEDAATSSVPPLLVQGSRTMPHVLVYAGKDNDDTIWSLRHTLKTSGVVEGTAIDVRGARVAVALVNGSVDIIARLEDMVNVDTTNIAFIDKIQGEEAATIVDVRLHPDGVHVVAATSRGLVLVGRLDTLQVVARFGTTVTTAPSSYTTGVLHPDGLIYVAADGATGDLRLWDFKSQSLAESTLSGGNDHGVVTALDCSNTGYHIGVAYKSSAVLVWDLRKQKVLTTLNTAEPNDDDKATTGILAAVVAVKFDDAGKFIAYSGNGPDGSLVVCIVTIKDWSKAVTLHAPNSMARGGLVWGRSSLAVSATPLTENDNPQVVVFALP